MSKILVTGGCGMIGSNLVKRLVKEGHEVFVIDNLWRGKLEYLNDENGNLSLIWIPTTLMLTCRKVWELTPSSLVSNM